MKILLSIIIMFLSSQSFADSIKGKALLCSNNIEYTYPKIKPRIEVYSFIKNNKYKYYVTSLEQDKYKIVESQEFIFYLQPDSIIISGYHINRKTLDFFNSLTNTSVGKCKVYNTHRKAIKVLKGVQKQYQQKHNKKLKGNKI